MTYLIMRRLLFLVPTLLAVSILSFAIMRAAPGDPIRLYTSQASGRVCSRCCIMITC